ncbi:TetR/AcrR family transcriptional regulator [Nocardia sp. NBC_01327]|uniref:TetR/AcrR family transcriptional regulator n=1 Tax=Nocardia sp. NBC_01327 TaxID=2903593 RepID=UPI002E133EEE|nr:TetR/AcrR family transcriptional regulator [Nocardia sp. NBC_01327]
MPRLTARTAEERRGRIIDAAMECFATRGLHATTMQDICRTAGLSPGAVYCWYPSKESIVNAVAEQRHRREREILETALRTADPRASLHSFLDSYFEWLADPEEQQRRRVGVQVWAESLVNDQLRQSISEGIGQRTLALDFVRAAQAAGTVPDQVDADAFTRIILAIIQGFILQQSWEPELDIESFRRALTLVVDALTPKSGS